MRTLKFEDNTNIDIEEILVKNLQARVVEFLSKSVDKEVLYNIPFFTIYNFVNSI